MREIADASGTGRTTLYRHFPDREALVAAIYERVLNEADEMTAAHLDGGRDADPVRFSRISPSRSPGSATAIASSSNTTLRSPPRTPTTSAGAAAGYATTCAPPSASAESAPT